MGQARREFCGGELKEPGKEELQQIALRRFQHPGGLVNSRHVVSYFFYVRKPPAIQKTWYRPLSPSTCHHFLSFYWRLGAPLFEEKNFQKAKTSCIPPSPRQ